MRLHPSSARREYLTLFYLTIAGVCGVSSLGGFPSFSGAYSSPAAVVNEMAYDSDPFNLG